MNESEMDIVPTGDAERYRTEWRTVQAGFVDDPEAAVRDADKLVEQVMDTVAGQLAARRKELSAGAKNTEQLRVALRRYRSLFQQLTGTPATDNGAPKPTTTPPPSEDNRAMSMNGMQRAMPPTDEKTVVPPSDDIPARAPSDEKTVVPPSDDIPAGPPSDDKTVAPPTKAKADAKKADAKAERSEPAVEGRDELVEHRADLPDTE